MTFFKNWLIVMLLMSWQSALYAQAPRPFPAGLPTCLEDDFRQLEALYDATNGDNWRSHTNWFSPNMATWQGITLTSGSCDVGTINLFNMRLDGNIPNLNLPNLRELDLGQNQLRGTIPNFNLPNLVKLQLTETNLTGSIPNFNLPNLTHLYLLYNQLTGSIPNFNLPNLKFLFLYNNQLTGNIPNFNLPKLEALLLYNNQLSNISNFNLPELLTLHVGNNQLAGSIPNFNLPKLQGLFLYNNQLVGSIPNFNFPYLKSLFLDDNELSGTIPNFNLPELTSLSLEKNQLTGNIPNFNLPKLNWLLLSDNQLTGIIPHFNLPLLHRMWLNKNRLSSVFPTLNVPNLMEVKIDSNKFTFDNLIPSFTNLVASNVKIYAPQDSIFTTTTYSKNIGETFTIDLGIDGAIPSNVYKWYKNGILYATTVVNKLIINRLSLTDAGIYTCQVTNPNAPLLTLYSRKVTLQVSAALSCRTQDSLVLVDLYNATGGANWTIRTNWLSANPINTWYGIQTDTNGCVTCIDLDGDANCAALAASGVGNHLVGMMPASLGNLARLQRLSLSNNTLSGNIPSSLGNLSNLQWLILHNNQLTGGIPTTLGQLANLQRLWLAYNPLGDTIPTNLGLLSQLRQLWLESNQLTGTIPSVLGQLTDLTYLSLYDNHLVGSIPTLFGSLTQVRTFALGKNQLTGNIPIQLGQLRSAEHLYFENNQLTGNIPTDFQNLTNLTHLSFQFNQIDSIPNLSMLTQLVELEADTNRLTYDDILPNLTRNITYRIQDSIFTETIFNKTIGSSFTLHLGIDGAITSNVYNWSKNNVFYRTTTVNQLIINGLTTSDAGAYTCQVTNPNAPNLTLYSRKALLRLLPTYVLDSTVVSCQGGFTPIRLTQSVENLNGYTIRLQFDSTKVMPDIETNHRLGRMIPAHDSVTLFQYVQNGVLILNLSLQGWQNISGNVGDTLIYLSWKPVLTAATPSVVALTGNVEASNAAGGQTIHPIQANIRTEINSATQFWVLYQGAGAMTQSTPTHPTVVKSGTQGNMTIRGNVSAAGLYFMRPMTGNAVQFQRQSLLSLGMPEIGGHDAFQQNLLIVDHPNAERNVSKLIAMDVNGDGLINSGDVSQVLRRAVNFQRGFRQSNSTDTMSWRHFPKSYLVSRPEYHLSTTFPNDNGIGISRLRVVKVDTLFRLDSAYYRPCDTSAMDVVAILVGDADGNYATVGTNAKGKLSRTVTLDARNALKMGQDTFKIPIYASETIFGLDVKIENHSDNLKIISLKSDVATLETNIDATTQSAYMSVYATRATGIGMNVPIAYMTVQSKCPKMPDFGKVTSYLNGETAGTEVTSRFCSTESGLKLFPNPVHQVLTIWYGDAQPTMITVFDAIGRKIKVVEPEAEQTILDMSGLVTGVYFVKVDDKTFKIVKQ